MDFIKCVCFQAIPSRRAPSLDFSKINIKGVTKAFDTSVILNNVNIQLEKQKFYCVLGHNGAGKTSLLNIIAKLDSDYQGEILL